MYWRWVQWQGTSSVGIIHYCCCLPPSLIHLHALIGTDLRKVCKIWEEGGSMTRRRWLRIPFGTSVMQLTKEVLLVGDGLKWWKGATLKKSCIVLYIYWWEGYNNSETVYSIWRGWYFNWTNAWEVSCPFLVLILCGEWLSHKMISWLDLNWS